MKLEDIQVESFATTGDVVAMMPIGTWMDATAGCCAPQPEPYPMPAPRTFYITCRGINCTLYTDDYE
jgi:hypothetical protein